MSKELEAWLSKLSLEQYAPAFRTVLPTILRWIKQNGPVRSGTYAGRRR
jgi:hypothetical protein